MKHIIKINEPYANAIIDGRKNFDVRYNDRGYNVGDEIEFSVVEIGGYCRVFTHPLNDKRYRITYVHSGLGLKEGYVVFGIKEITDGSTDTGNA